MAHDTNSTWGWGGVLQVRITVNWLSSGYTASSAPVCVMCISSQWHCRPLFVWVGDIHPEYSVRAPWVG